MKLFEVIYWEGRGIFAGGGRRRIRPTVVVSALVIVTVAVFSLWAASHYGQAILRAIGKIN